VGRRNRLPHSGARRFPGEAREVNRPERSSLAYPVSKLLGSGEKIELPPFELRIELKGLTMQPSDRLAFPIRYKPSANGFVGVAYVYAPLGLQ
jgi:hypothetical protein